MFRKQKVKDQLMVISGEGSNRADIQRVRTIPSCDLLSSSGKGRQSWSPLLRIVSQQSAIAVIDKNEEAWLISEPFTAPVNLSSLLRRRVQRVFLGEKEIIVQSKGEYVLLNWGSVKALEGRQLMRISTFSSNESEALLLAYLIPDAQHATAFHYSLQKKAENSNRLYEIRPDNCEIVAHPTLSALRTIRPVRGVSVGRHHALCWDDQGELFSWGCRSLGLGFGSLPSEDLVEQPQRVKLSKHVLMAFAATHYSLALTSEGVLYEWGIKPEYNQINEEPIFAPRPLHFRFFKCTARFVALKGREDNFAALASNGHLYVWGLNARRLLAPNIQLPAAWQGSHIYEPVLQTDLLAHRVRDFSVEINSLSVILAGGEEPEEEYWQVLKEKARLQLACFKGNRICTDASESLARLRRKYRNPILGEPRPNATERREPVVSVESKMVSKPPSERRGREKHESVDHSSKFTSFKRTAPLTITCWPIPNHKRQVSDFFGYSSPMAEGMNLRCSELGFSVTSRREEVKKFSENYSIRLQGVLEKKQKLESLSLATNLKRIDEADVEFKLKKKQDEETRRRKLQQETVLKGSLSSFLVKSFLSRLLTSPLDCGRQALIASFSRSLVLVRVQKNIKRLFVDAKVKFSMMALQKDRFPRYALLALYFKNYVMKFRERRGSNFRQKAVQALVGRVAKEKIRVGVGRLALPVGRIGRLGQWLKRFNKERLRILKELWNNFVLVTLKPTDGGQLNLHAAPEATFAERYQQALEGRSVGGLDLSYRGCVRMGQARLTNKKSLSELKRRANTRFAEEFRLSASEILPYSLHYNALRRPKQLDISVAESARASSWWIEVERKTLSEQLRGILARHDRTFYLRRREYELDLANYLKQRYDTFYELRWRFIIEYNKVERTADKRRKEKQLRRLLALVGMQRLVDEDCIPEKSLVLEEALRRRDAPLPPSPVLDFGLGNFESAFRTYWESLHAKAKQIRKRNL